MAGEVATAGLNAIREICARAPLAMNATLLQDLVEYKGSKDKGVMMASRSLITLYREVAPEMLKKKDRGKTASMGMKEHIELRYGQEQAGFIEGLELLEAWKAEQKAAKRAELGLGTDDEEEEDDEDEVDDEEAWAKWDVESDDSEDEGNDWINVESDGEDINISDSEDDDAEAAKQKKKKRRVSTTAEEKEEEEKKNEEAKEAAVLKAVERKMSKLATTRILTPADFAKMEELRQEAGLAKLMGKNMSYVSLFEPGIIVRVLTCDSQPRGRRRAEHDPGPSETRKVRQGRTSGGRHGGPRRQRKVQLQPGKEAGREAAQYHQQGEGAQEEFPHDAAETQSRPEDEVDRDETTVEGQQREAQREKKVNGALTAAGCCNTSGVKLGLFGRPHSGFGVWTLRIEIYCGQTSQMFNVIPQATPVLIHSATQYREIFNS